MIKDCLAVGSKDITFVVEGDDQKEFVYMLCSKTFGQCLHQNLPKFRKIEPSLGAELSTPSSTEGNNSNGFEIETFIVSCKHR